MGKIKKLLTDFVVKYIINSNRKVINNYEMGN